MPEPSRRQPQCRRRWRCLDRPATVQARCVVNTHPGVGQHGGVDRKFVDRPRKVDPQRCGAADRVDIGKRSPAQRHRSTAPRCRCSAHSCKRPDAHAPSVARPSRFGALATGPEESARTSAAPATQPFPKRSRRPLTLRTGASWQKPAVPLIQTSTVWAEPADTGLVASTAWSDPAFWSAPLPSASAPPTSVLPTALDPLLHVPTSRVQPGQSRVLLGDSRHWVRPR